MAGRNGHGAGRDRQRHDWVSLRQFPSVKIGLLICPDDGNASIPGVPAPLSFMVNSNVCNNRLMSLTGGVVNVNVSQLQRSSRTLLLGEGPMLTVGSTSWSATTTLTFLPPQPQPPSSPDLTRQWNWTDSLNNPGFYADDGRICSRTAACFPPMNLTFTWNAVGAAPAPFQPHAAFPQPSESWERVHLTYCDGHVEALLTDADCSTISTRVDGGIP